MRFKKVFILSTVLIAALTFSGCGLIDGVFNNVSSLVGLNETGTVIAKSAQIRSSYAVVAADLLEVKRGETVDILDETDFEKVHWYRVHAHDEDDTEGWIEAQNLIVSDVLDKSKKLAEEDKDLQPQAVGQLRAASNLRLSPEQNDDNILFKLDDGSNFEITGWKYVPKAQDAPDADDNSNIAAKQPKNKSKNPDIVAAGEKDDPDKLDETYDIWYKVRLDPSVSPAPAGWLFGRQVELQLP
ncbi:MAG: SH3 domain-containing protein, partial [Acidobacteriota bacterium]